MSEFHVNPSPKNENENAQPERRMSDREYRLLATMVYALVALLTVATVSVIVFAFTRG